MNYSVHAILSSDLRLRTSNPRRLLPHDVGEVFDLRVVLCLLLTARKVVTANLLLVEVVDHALRRGREQESVEELPRTVGSCGTTHFMNALAVLLTREPTGNKRK